MSTLRRSSVNRTKEYYERNAKRWSETKTNSFHHEKQFIKLLSLLPKNSNIVDVGCAGGIHVPLFLGMGRNLRYTGIDVSKRFLSIAKRRYPQLTFREGDIIDKRTLPRQKFDGFWASAVLMHVPLTDWETAFDNLESLLKPNAYGYITLPIAHPSGEKSIHDPRHFTLLSEREQVAFMKNRGWKILQKTWLSSSQNEKIWKGYIIQIQ